MQPPAPASSLAEPPPAGSKPTTGAVDLSVGAAIREDALSAAGACCCQSVAAAVLLLCCCCAAAAAASTTTALAFLRLVTNRSGMIIDELATTTVSCIY